jgi:protein phosphatase
MAYAAELETTQYEFSISPSALDLTAPKPPSSGVTFEFSAVTDRGKVRTNNEDHFLVSQISRRHHTLSTNVSVEDLPAQAGDDGYIMVVADGMGGMAAGDVASRVAISAGVEIFQRSPKWGFKINKKEARELFERISEHLRKIDQTLTAQSEADHRLYGMGTTLTVSYSVGVDLFIIHLGDSRAYLFRAGQLQQLTKDHTVAQAMADAGYISAEDVRHHRKRHVLTNFLGGHHGKVKGDVRWLRLRDDDRLLLCSDGLTDMVDDESIARILETHDSPADATQALLAQALNHGGLDNITIIVGRYGIPALVRDETPEAGS